MLVKAIRKSFSKCNHFSTSPATVPGIVFDIDGVLLRGSTVIPTARETLKKLDESRVPYIFLTNGGGYPESRKAESLSKLLERDIHGDQVIMCHTPMRSLVDEHKDDLVIIIGKRYEHLIDAAKGYGYKYIITSEEYHAHHPFLYTDLKPPAKKDEHNFVTERKVGAIMAMIDPIEWGRDIQVCCDIINSTGLHHSILPNGAPQQVKFYNFCADFQYPTELQVPRFGAGAFNFALQTLFKEFHKRDMVVTNYGKPHSLSYEFAQDVLNKFAISRNYSKQGIHRFYGIGDNPQTDVMGANNAGNHWVSVLVRTGLFQGNVNDKVNPAKIIADDVKHALQIILKNEKIRMEEEEAGGPILLGGKHPQRIFMLDNSLKTLLLDNKTTAEDICVLMASKLNFENPKRDARYFSLFEALNGAHVNRSLGDAEILLDVVNSWDSKTYPNALIVYQVKLFMESLFKNTPPKVLQMLYIQAVHHIITGVYPCSEDSATYLAGLQVQIRYGEHKADLHKVGFLTEKLAEFIPSQLLALKEASLWETLIFQEHKQMMGRFESTDPRLEYIITVKDFPTYGNQFFTVEQDEWKKYPKVVALGISQRGIYMFRPGNMELLMEFKLSEVYRWGFQPGVNFYFEIKNTGGAGAGPFHRFKTEQGQKMSDLLTDYAMALLREMGIHKDSDDEDEEDEEEEEDNKAGNKLSKADAATKIAAVYRGHKCRKDFDQMIAEMEKELST